MHCIVFVPGIMGSELRLGNEEVWPPTETEALFGYNRTDKLIDPAVTVGDVIEKVCCDVYRPLTRLLADEVAGAADHLFIRHPYDWRRDLLLLADELEQRLASLVAQHGAGTTISLICHSMGGLIARACLERPRASPPAWGRAVRLAAFLATPHEGAPLALARAVGVGGSSLGLNAAQLRRLSGAAGFPAAYQLLPPAHVDPIWRLDGDPPFAAIDVFDPQLGQDNALNAAHLAATRLFQAALEPARRPLGCRYFAVASATHETLIRFDEERGRLTPVKLKGTGDGTVPVRSASALPVQTGWVDANHIGVAQSRITLDLLAMLLGLQQPEAIAASVVAERRRPVVSVSETAVTEDEAYEIVVAAGETPARLSGELVIEKEGADASFATVQTTPVQADIAGLKRLALDGPRLRPGRYRVRFDSAAGEAEPADLLVMHRNADD